MASSLLVLATILALSSFCEAGLILTVANNCPFTFYPVIQPNAGHFVIERGSFVLHSLTHRSFPAPTTHWSGRIWARTGCTTSNGHFHCATGECGNRVECNGLGGAPLISLAQFSLHHGGHKDQYFYEVSLVDGFNVPLIVTPHEGKGVCPVIGCKANLLATYPQKLHHRSPVGHGPIVGCKSGCATFGTDELCCKNHYNSPQTCRDSSFSQFFKHACLATFTYAHDSPSLMHDCSSPCEPKVIFYH